MWHDLLVGYKNTKTASKPSQDFFVNWLGVKTDMRFFTHRPEVGGKILEEIPSPCDFDGVSATEYASCIIAVEQRADPKKFTAVELGASYGHWLANSGVIARRLGVSDLHLVGVEADQTRCDALHDHLIRNSLTKDDGVTLKIIRGAAWPRDETLYFGITDSFWDHGGAATKEKQETDYRGRGVENVSFTEVQGFSLQTICGNLNPIDYMHIDIQGAELKLVKASIDMLTRSVRHLFIGTHSISIHGQLVEIFHKHKWELISHSLPRFRYDREAPTLEGRGTRDGDLFLANPSCCDQTYVSAREWTKLGDCSGTELAEAHNQVTHTERNLATMQGEFERIAKELSDVQGELAGVRCELATSHSEVERLGQELATSHSEVERLGQELATSHGERERLGQELATSHGERERLGQELISSHSEVERLGQELATSHGERERLGQELISSHSEVERLGQELISSHSEVERLGQELISSHSEVERLGQELISSHSEVERLGQELISSHSEVERLGQELIFSHSEVERLGQELISSHSELERLGQELISFHSEVERLGQELISSHSELERLGQELAVFQRDLDQLVQERDQLVHERDQLARERDQLVHERDQLARERDQLVQERDQLVQERDTSQQELRSVYRSRSWRVTSPLRSVSHGLRVVISYVRSVIRFFVRGTWAWMTFKPGCRPRRTLGRVVRFLLRKGASGPRLRRYGQRVLRRFPRLEWRLRGMIAVPPVIMPGEHIQAAMIAPKPSGDEEQALYERLIGKANQSTRRRLNAL